MGKEAGEEYGTGEVSLAHGEEEKNEGGDPARLSFKADGGILFVASHTNVTRFFSGVLPIRLSHVCICRFYPYNFLFHAYIYIYIDKFY